MLKQEEYLILIEINIQDTISLFVKNVWVQELFKRFKSYQCQKCGETIGYLGRFFQLFGLFHYDCDMPIKVELMPQYLVNKGCPKCLSNVFVSQGNWLYCGECETKILCLNIKKE